MMIDGIDVSALQGDIEWSQIYDGGHRFAFLKSSEGTSYVDRRFSGYRRGAADAGLIIGAYHFARFQNPEKEAQHAWQSCESLGLEDRELAPVIDMEANAPLHWNRDQVSAWLKAWIICMEELCGKKPIIYMSPNYASTTVTPEAWQLQYPIWVAQYSKLGPWHPSENQGPNTPEPWGRWDFWQYSGGGWAGHPEWNGKPVRGVSVPCDRNVFRGTEEGLEALARRPPPPECQDTPIVPVA